MRKRRCALSRALSTFGVGLIPRSSLEALNDAGAFYGAAVSEAQAVQEKEVYVAGAGNSAGQAEMHLSKYAPVLRSLSSVPHRAGALTGEVAPVRSRR